MTQHNDCGSTNVCLVSNLTGCARTRSLLRNGSRYYLTIAGKKILNSLMTVVWTV